MDKVVVVTGASSGIGRELAMQLVERGDTVVLAARREEALEAVAARARRLGERVSVVPTDVTRAEEVERLRDAAIERWGRVDAWINDAGVAYFSALTEGSAERHLRVIETNLFGVIHGARAIVPHFRARGRGVLVNVSSMLGKTGHPFVPSYAISKFGLRGLSESLRVELADEPDVHVCTVFPYATETPHFEGAASEIDRCARAMPPVQSPEKVARVIARLLDRPRSEVHVPRLALLALGAKLLLPRASERLLLHALLRYQFDERPGDLGEGNLYVPSRDPGHVHGDRPPRVGMPRMALWAAGELARIEADQARRWWRGAWGRAEAARVRRSLGDVAPP